MLYLHCGWSKTGTKSLQAALLSQREAMARQGIVYPECWQYRFGPQDLSHNDLFTRIEDASGSDAAIGELSGFLEAHAGRDVLISAEILTDIALREDGRGRLAHAISAAREVMPVTCIWTLRRFDEFMRARFLQRVSLGVATPAPAEHMKRADGSKMFDGMLKVAEHVDQSFYLEYDAGGQHNLDIFEIVGVSTGLVRALDFELTENSRRNPSLTHKQAVALLHCDALSARAAVSLEPKQLVRAFELEGFEFDADCRCELVGISERTKLCHRALETARNRGFQPYCQYFAGDYPTGLPECVDMSTDIVTDADLSRLVAHLRGEEPA